MEEERPSGEPSTFREAEKEEEEGERKEQPRKGGTSSAAALQLELDHILEETARRKNLSVMNVKSILRVSTGVSMVLYVFHMFVHMLRDKGVLVLYDACVFCSMC